MKLSADEFNERFKNSTLKIAFIGMSNIGKSYTAQRLADRYEFTMIDVDKNIQAALGHDTMAEFAAWQGQPYEAGYTEREARSVELETEATADAMSEASGNVILDTAGSVIYTSGDVLETLKREFYIVHITADADDMNRLKALYFDEPKPLVWAGHFKAECGQSNAENIAACYPALLASREKAYAALADQALSSKFILAPETTADNIFTALSAL